MPKMTQAQIARSRRAYTQAVFTLKPGDRISVEGCGGMKSTVTMTGWDGHWITSATRSDIAAVNIYKVNGMPVDFGAETPHA